MGVEVREVPGEVPDAVAVAGVGVYGTVEDPATRYVALVGTGFCDSAEAADEERLTLINWKLDWASLELVAWQKVEVVAMVAEEASETLFWVFTMLIET